MKQRLPSRDRDHGCAALVNRGKTLLRGEVSAQNFDRMLNLAAPRTRQIAAKERLEHQREREALATRELLLDDVRADFCRLAELYCHESPMSDIRCGETTLRRARSPRRGGWTGTRAPGSPSRTYST